MFFFILVHDYILYFIGSPCHSVSYYNYITECPYYIVIHFTILTYVRGVTLRDTHFIIVKQIYNWLSTMLYPFNSSTLLFILMIAFSELTSNIHIFILHTIRPNIICL